MMDYTLPAWKIKQLKKFHKTLKQKHEADRIKAVILLGNGFASERSGRKNYAHD